MQTRVRSARFSNGTWFALIALSFLAFTLALPSLRYLASDRSTAAIGVLLLFTVELPLIFWLLVLRPRDASLLYAVPVAAMGYLFCRLWTPGQDSAWIAWGWLPLMPLELLLAAALARRVLRAVRHARRLPRSADIIERLVQASYAEFPSNRVFAVLMYEIGIVYYALGGKAGLILRGSEAAFTNYRRGGLRVIYGLALVLGAFEIVGVHLMVAALSPPAAWVLTGFELYGIAWVVGLLRSVPQLPVVLGERGIQVRLGVMYALYIPFEEIAGVQLQGLHSVDSRRRNYLNCAFINAPDCVLKLRAPRPARLPYTLSRSVDEIGVMVDEPRKFLALLQERLASTHNGAARS